MTHRIDWRISSCEGNWRMWSCDGNWLLRRHPASIFSNDLWERNAPSSNRPVHLTDLSWSEGLGSKWQAQTSIPALYPLIPNDSKSGMSLFLSFTLGIPCLRRHLEKAHSSIRVTVWRFVWLQKVRNKICWGYDWIGCHNCKYLSSS